MNYFLLAALIVAGIFMLWDEKKNWKLLYETTGHAMQEVQARFAYLKSQGIKCRIKTAATRGMIFRGITSSSGLASVKLEVHKKDLKKARSLLSEPGEKESKR